MYKVFCNSKAHRKYQPYSKEYNGFEEYNETVKNEWLSEGFKNNPDITVVYCD